MLSDSHSPAKEGTTDNAGTDYAHLESAADLTPHPPALDDSPKCDRDTIDPPPERSLAVVARAPAAPAPRFELDQAQPLDLHSFPNPPRSKGAGPPATIPNMRHLLKSYGITVRYDVIKKALLITMPGYTGCPDNFDNVAMTYVLSLATLNGIDTRHLPNYLEVEGDRHQHNPVADWICSRPWDRVDRLEAHYATLVERADFPVQLKKTLMHRWALSAVAAALKPTGFHCRGVLTLQGPQSIGKTAWCRSLVSDDALRRAVIKVDHHLDGSNKDTVITAVTHWIVEIGELDSSFKKDVARLKGFLTADCDKLRRPYAKGDSSYQRRTVFCASVNEETFLVDPTGNTRWWTIPVTAVNYAHGLDMQQVFAQLAVEFQSGEPWWLSPQEEASLEEHNKPHRAVNVIRETVLEKLDLDRRNDSELPWMTAGAVLRTVDIKSPSNAQARECGAALRELLGEPTVRQGSNKWRVPLRITDLNNPSMDDDDLY